MKLISSILYDYTLLPYFVKHYEEQGVEHFYFFVYNMDFNLEIKNCTFLKSVLDQSEFSAELDCDIRNFMRNIFVRPEEWYIIADLDELSTIDDLTIKEATVSCDALGNNAILGEFYDRVTIDGSIPTCLSENIWEQFPVVAPVTRSIRIAPTNKIVATKGDIGTTPGHHAPTLHINPFSSKAKVNHFSWWGDIVDRFEKRCKSKSHNQVKGSYRNIIRYLEKNNKIVIKSYLQ